MPPLHKTDLEMVLLRSRVPYGAVADAQLVAIGKQGVITAAVLTADADAAHVEILDGGAGGTVLFQVKAPAGETRPVTFPVGLRYTDGVYANFVAGTDPALTVVACD